jgi:hypothetical protein
MLRINGNTNILSYFDNDTYGVLKLEKGNYIFESKSMHKMRLHIGIGSIYLEGKVGKKQKNR